MDICRRVVPAEIWIDDVLVKCHKYTEETSVPVPAYPDAGQEEG